MAATDIEVSVYTKLQTACPRVYPCTLPKNPTFPSITYQVVSESPIMRLSGGPSLASRKRFQMDAWDKTYEGAKALASSAVAALSDGTLRAEPLVSFDTYEAEEQLFRVTLDWTIWN